MMTVNLGSHCPLSGDFWCLQHLNSFQGRSKDLKKKNLPSFVCVFFQVIVNKETVITVSLKSQKNSILDKISRQSNI